MTIDEIKNKAYRMAKNEEYEEQKDLMENFLCIQLYAVYRMLLSGLMPEKKARAMAGKAISDYKLFSLYRKMYMKNTFSMTE